MIVYRLTDRLPIKIDELTFWIAPLSFEKKQVLSTYTRMNGGVETIDFQKVAVATLKFTIKGVEGLTLADGSDYELEFDPAGDLTDESVDVLLRLVQNERLIVACSRLANEFKEHEIPGVVIDMKGVVTLPKKKKVKA
jgi:hypothetical protein